MNVFNVKKIVAYAFLMMGSSVLFAEDIHKALDLKETESWEVVHQKYHEKLAEIRVDTDQKAAERARSELNRLFALYDADRRVSDQRAIEKIKRTFSMFFIAALTIEELDKEYARARVNIASLTGVDNATILKNVETEYDTARLALKRELKRLEKELLGKASNL